MYKKRWVAMALDGAGVEEPPKLAVPEKEPDTGYIMPVEDQLFGMLIKLVVKAVQFG